MKSLLFALLLSAAPLALAATPATDAGDAAAHEIDHLLAQLSASGCEFERNGRWHAPTRARAHLERKLRHARKRAPGLSADQFIEHAASRSSLSGEPYRVRCAGRPVLTSAAWFRQVLRDFRRRD